MWLRWNGWGIASCTVVNWGAWCVDDRLREDERDAERERDAALGCWDEGEAGGNEDGWACVGEEMLEDWREWPPPAEEVVLTAEGAEGRGRVWVVVVMDGSEDAMGVDELGRRAVTFIPSLEGSRPPGPEPELLPVLNMGLVGLALAVAFVGVVFPDPAGDLFLLECDISDGRPRAPGV